MKSLYYYNYIFSMLRYKILNTWNGGGITHQPIELHLESDINDPTGIRFTVKYAPFFNNTPPPSDPGEPFMGLWDYEVVEAFFLNDKDEYLEVEVAPGGQHIVLLLAGQRNTIRHSLPMRTSTYISGDSWSGYATIPGEYLPFNVTKFNAYAIYNDENNDRIYEALYPADKNASAPDFHALQYFKSIDMNSIFQKYPVPMSRFWEDALQGIFRYNIETQWNSVPIDHSNSVEVSIQSTDGGIIMKVKAPFFDDPAPTEPAGSLMGLWNYEVVEMFFLNNKDEYVEVELGPHGHYIVLLLKGQSNSIKDSLPLKFNAQISSSRVSIKSALHDLHLY